MVKYMEVGAKAEMVPRTPESPSPHEVYVTMTPGEPYTVGELASEFDDASRWTIQNRLDTLVEQGFVERKKHAANRVSYWVPGDA